MAPMTPEQFTRKMANLQRQYYDIDADEEEAHWHMDRLICQVMREVGYGDGIDIFEDTPKKWD